MTRRELAHFWDEQIERWFREEPFPQELYDWEHSVRGKLVDAEDWAFPDPFTGDLLGSPRIVLLATNPGGAHRDLQSRDGCFAPEIKELGYTRWVAGWPYEGGDSPWVKKYGNIGFSKQRREFAGRFLRDPSIDFHDMLTVELYPFHSRSLTGGRIEVQPHTLNKFLLETLSEFGDVPVLAIASATWKKALDLALDRDRDLVKESRLIEGFEPSPKSGVPERKAAMYRLRGGARILVEWHRGGPTPAGKGKDHDVDVLRRAWFEFVGGNAT